jgi:hypothetical protein
MRLKTQQPHRPHPASPHQFAIMNPLQIPMNRQQSTLHEGDFIYRPDKRNVKHGDIPLSSDVEDNAVFYLASSIVKRENTFGHPILNNVNNYDVKCPYCKEKAITFTGSLLQFLNMYHSPHSASNLWTLLVSMQLISWFAFQTIHLDQCTLC